MNQVFGELLPLAVGVAISPIPIIAAILMLLAGKAGATSLGFLLGWVAGIAMVTGVSAALAAAGFGGSDEPSSAVSWLKMGLGVLLLILAVQQ
ncbi:GAP family protein, partial [Actinoplanes sp. NPDC051633]|uniref:GAP family protein n=1 Tax=Actinoplanes sp. NPDC051633 TaxID=3155670 RepID=UPI0034299645